MSADVPAFAVVGRVNKGKSSIVSTLVEDESVRIDRAPGTTQECEVFDLRVHDRVLCRLIDTPGFEEAPRALAWMRAREGSAAERPRVVQEFVHAFRDGEEFGYERKLLTPILQGAGILYVVDASRPYRPNYEAEMEILRWTGQPRMALLNTIGEEDHVAEWRRALDQYFRIGRVFHAQRSTFEDRIGLLRAFRELRQDGREAMDGAIAELEADWRRRGRQGAAQIADFLVDALTFTLEWPIEEGESPDARREEWLEKFRDALRKREREERDAVETIYRHDRLKRSEAELGLAAFENDLFGDTTWRVLGLDTWQLVRAGVIGGAAVGGMVDVAVGGASFLAGSLIGGVIGGLSSYYGAASASQVEMLGRRLGGPVARIGPLKNANFAWLLLDRALLHHRSVVRRAHARRDPFVVSEDGRRGLVSRLGAGEQNRLSRLFVWIQRSGGEISYETRDELVDRIEELLGRGPEAVGE
jgi:hypothetical protein